MSNEHRIQLDSGAVEIDAVEVVDHDGEITEERAAELVDAVHRSTAYRKALAASQALRARPPLPG
ncbi:hypothetical protein [Jiangella rhizosphaerae]|uniref:hypothetical protein n=1 Tax=Jiangella rhizosphaerae TaxID=2293569 RepID=UPI0011C47ECB|nr:hypothetical protein [Jiangella rhizosphaerae]